MIQVDEKEEFFRDLKTIKNDSYGRVVLREHLNNAYPRGTELNKIIAWHPEIIFQCNAPDTELLLYLMRAKKIDINKITPEEFKKKIPAISTIRNFRRKVILDLQKKGYFLENEKKLREKDMYIKNKYMSERL